MATEAEAHPFLVTGGAGFMGTHVVRALTSQRRGRVVVLDDLSGGFRENVPADAEFVHGSITDHGPLDALFEQYRAVSVAMSAPGHPIQHLPLRNEVQIAYNDHGLVRTVFGEYAETPLAARLSRMAKWAHAAGARTSRPFDGVEVTHNMPPSWRRLFVEPEPRP